MKAISFVIGIMILVSMLIATAFITAGNAYHEKLALKNQLDSLSTELTELKVENERYRFYYKAFYVENRIKKVSVTGYHPVEEQCDSTPNETADGTFIEVDKAGEYRYVALSRDLLSNWGGPFDYGDIIYIKGLGYRDDFGNYYPSPYDGIYQVRDTMNPRHTNWVDILLTPGEGSFYKKNVSLRKVEIIDEYAFAELFGRLSSDL